MASQAVTDVLAILSSSDFWLAGVYVFITVVAWHFARRLNASENHWHFEDLLTNDQGKASLAHVLQSIGSVTMTWAFVYFTIQKSLTDTYAAIYAGYHAAVYGIQKFSATSAPPPTGIKPP